jgi:hypothetical protein
MLSMSGIRGDAGIDACRTKPKRCMRRVVIAMDQIVNKPWVVLMVSPNFFHHARGSHIGRDVAAAMGSA